MKKYDVVFPQNYTVNGEEKTRWLNCGAVIATKNGHRLKLDSIPVGVSSEGGGLWFSLFEPKPRDEAPLKIKGFEDDTDIPF